MTETLTVEQQGAIIAALGQFFTSLKVSGFVAWIIERMKMSESRWFDWINSNTPWVTRFVAALGAALTAVGIQHTWDPQQHVFVVTGLTYTAIIGATWHIATNYLLQHGWYKTVFASDHKDASPKS